MPRILGLAPLALVLACAPVEPSGDLFAPATVAAPAAAAPAPTPVDDPDLADIFDERDDLDDDFTEEVNPARLAAGLGLGALPEAAEPAPAPAPPAAAPPAPPAMTYLMSPAWTPGTPLDGSFGIRLVSTVIDAQPPRAILGMPSGIEEVVQPGTLLPEVGVVVLAIGRDVVQVAEIVPAGDHARVETRLLTSLYPGSGGYGASPAP